MLYQILFACKWQKEVDFFFFLLKMKVGLYTARFVSKRTGLRTGELIGKAEILIKSRNSG